MYLMLRNFILVLMFQLLCSLSLAQSLTCSAIFEIRFSKDVQEEEFYTATNDAMMLLANRYDIPRWKNFWALRNVGVAQKKWKRYFVNKYPENPEPLTLHPDYWGENYGPTTVAQGKLRVRIRYFDAFERDHFEVALGENGLYFVSTGRPVHGELSGTFVFSVDHKIYVRWYNPKDDNSYRHSSFMGGAPVLFAGNITIQPDGRITRLDKLSGHYRPSDAHLAWVKQQLGEMGFLLPVEF